MSVLKVKDQTTGEWLEIQTIKGDTGPQGPKGDKGDKVWYPEKDTKIYESLIDANVYSPEAYPAGWKEIS